MSEPTIRALLADAVRRVNVRYNQIPADRRPKIRWEAADDALEAVLTAGDRGRALEAIDEWENHWMTLFGEVSR